MILYFTGTGNSQFVASVLAKELEDNLISINEILKENENKWEFYSKTPYVIVAPIYAWRFPRKIEEFLQKAKFTGNQSIYMIGTMGADAGETGKYCKKISEKKKMRFMGFQGICMPNNYFLSSKMPTKEEAIAKIKEELPNIRELGKQIKNHQPFLQMKDRTIDWILSSVVNWGFSTFMVGNNHFTVDHSCTKCKKCVKECPVNNITLYNDKIQFKNQCMFCLRCVSLCPVHAIDYKGKSKKNGRYLCDVGEEIF